MSSLAQPSSLPDISQNRSTLLWRVAVVVGVLSVETATAAFFPHPWPSLHWFKGAEFVFGCTLLYAGRRRLLESQRGGFLLRRGFLWLHVAGLALYTLLERGFALSWIRPGAAAFVIAWAVWLALVPCVIVSATLTLVSGQRLIAAAKGLGVAWIYAALSTVVVAVARGITTTSWDDSNAFGKILQALCFNETKWLLKIFGDEVVSNPSTYALGTPRFYVYLKGACCGIEGLMLVFVVSTAWLTYTRRELRIRRALLLVPVALVSMWFLNIARLAALIKIGDLGHPDVAMNGFHAQAGWIAFNVVSFGFIIVAQRVQWFRRTQPVCFSVQTLPRKLSPGCEGAYLYPFVAILVATLIGEAASNGFEWLYPLRFFGAAVVLWIFRRELRLANWRCGTLGIVGGLAVAMVWLAVAHMFSATQSDPQVIAHGLSELPRGPRWFWIATRVLASITTVPIAEELAFRGFLARRLVSRHFESVSYARLSVTSIILSSLAFGMMHGPLWAPATLAGLVFAIVAKRTDRLGEAAGAHVIANLCLALVAITTSNYTIW